MPVPSLTADELAAVLKRTSLPTILVEGSGDAQAYRHIEDLLPLSGASTLPCGGRSTLLEMYKRKAEFEHIKLAFLADRDMWVFDGIPSGYDDIVWTRGYSIENDLYGESGIDRLLTPAERERFTQLIASTCRWFAFCVEEYKAGRASNVSLHLTQVVPPGTTALSNTLAVSHGFYEPSQQTYSLVLRNYETHLRGKTLFEILLRLLSAAERRSKYSAANIVELCIKLRTPPAVSNIVAELSERLSAQPGKMS